MINTDAQQAPLEDFSDTFQTRLAGASRKRAAPLKAPVLSCIASA
jgi:hypothetical protein